MRSVLTRLQDALTLTQLIAYVLNSDKRVDGEDTRLDPLKICHDTSLPQGVDALIFHCWEQSPIRTS